MNNKPVFVGPVEFLKGTIGEMLDFFYEAWQNFVGFVVPFFKAILIFIFLILFPISHPILILYVRITYPRMVEKSRARRKEAMDEYLGIKK